MSQDPSARASLPGGWLARFPPAELFQVGLAVIGPDRARLAAVVVLTVISSGMEVVLLGLVAGLILSATGSHLAILPLRPGFSSVSQQLLLGGVLTVLLTGLAFPLAALQASLSVRAMDWLRERLLRAYYAARLQYRDSHREGFLIQLVGEYSFRAEQLVQSLVSVATAGVSLLVFLAAAVWVAPRTTFFLLAGLALCLSLGGPLARRKRQALERHKGAGRELITQVGESARLTEEITVFDVSPRIVEGLVDLTRQASGHLLRVRMDGRLMPSLFQYGGIAVVLALLTLHSLAGARDYAGLVPLAFLLLRGLGFVKTMIASQQNGAEMLPPVRMLAEEAREMEAQAAPRGHQTPDRFTGLAVEGAAYAYKPGQPVVQQIHLTIRPGEMVGIVGTSGSGKSTLAALLLGLRSPHLGRVRMGGVDLADISPTAWSRMTAFVAQDSKLIHASVADNIRFFRPGFSLLQIRAAARAAHIDADIAALPEGFETVIGTGARGLSGGQRQRLAIARALLGAPQLLVLDEPTSALDQESERLIAQTLAELKGRVTIVLIAHRPATLTVCDRVLKMEKGRLVENAAAQAS